MVRKKAQVAMEYIILVGIILAVLVPASFLFYNYARESSASVKTAQISKLGNEMMAKAEQVYYMGPPATLKIESRMPDNIRNMQIVPPTLPVTHYALIFDVATDAGAINELVFTTTVPIQPEEFGASSYSQGIKKVRIEAKKDALGDTYIWISTKSKCTDNSDCSADETCVAFVSDKECVKT